MPPTPEAARLRTGLTAAIACFALWGLSPLYWRLLDHVSPFEILAHRVVWAVALLAAILVFRKSLLTVLRSLKDPKVRWPLVATAALISINWFLFIWSVATEQVLQASLGYYINPLMSVLAGFLFLGERLNRPQILAVLLAAAGVAVLAAGLEGFPWISLALASTFAVYGLIRKTLPVQSVDGLFVETLLVLPVALAYLTWLGGAGTSDFGPVALGGAGLWTMLLLIGAGPFTALPLFLFTVGAQRLRLATVGLTQYLAPTIQFVLAVAFFGEALTVTHIVTFALIWTGLAVYTGDAIRRDGAQRRAARAAAAASEAAPPGGVREVPPAR